MRPPPTVTVERSAIADIGYGLLAAVDLGRDAANLYAPRREFDRLALAPAPAWAAALQAALRAHPRDALVLQGWPLRTPSLADLAAPPVAPALLTPWARAVAAESRAAEVRAFALAAPSPATPSLASLPALLAALWQPLGAEAPATCRVLDCRPLGPHGRTHTQAGVFVVATSLDEAADHPLMQIFHEAAHPVTDAAVFARLGAEAHGARRTAAGTPGFEVHRVLEATAVAYGQAVLEAHAPSVLPAYRAWCSRWVYSD